VVRNERHNSDCRRSGAFRSLALDQLEACARYDGMARIVGLPDLHAGNGIAVGAAFWSPSHVWPHLVGSDIGCGMALWETDLPLRKFRLSTVERKLHGLDALGRRWRSGVGRGRIAAKFGQSRAGHHRRGQPLRRIPAHRGGGR
jgi:RNA-splicing ligase RtcB